MLADAPGQQLSTEAQPQPLQSPGEPLEAQPVHNSRHSEGSGLHSASGQAECGNEMASCAILGDQPDGLPPVCGNAVITGVVNGDKSTTGNGDETHKGKSNGNSHRNDNNNGGYSSSNCGAGNGAGNGDGDGKGHGGTGGRHPPQGNSCRRLLRRLGKSGLAAAVMIVVTKAAATAHRTIKDDIRQPASDGRHRTASVASTREISPGALTHIGLQCKDIDQNRFSMRLVRKIKITFVLCCIWH